MSKKTKAARPVIVSVTTPMIACSIDLVGDHSLVGAFAKELIERGWTKHVGLLNPSEVIFYIRRVQPGVNLYKELNAVRDIFKIDEKRITLVIR
jgi:hypothetical protein